MEFRKKNKQGLKGLCTEEVASWLANLQDKRKKTKVSPFQMIGAFFVS